MAEQAEQQEHRRKGGRQSDSLGGQRGLKPCSWPAGTPMVSTAGSRNWISSLGNTGSTYLYACWPRPTSGQVKSSGRQTMFVTATTG